MKFIIKSLVLFSIIVTITSCTKTKPLETTKAWELVTSLTTPNRFNYVGFINEKFGVTVGESGYVYYTSNSGVTWKPASNDSDGRYSLDFLNSNLICSGGSSGVVMTSEDSGNNWNPGATDFPLSYEDNNIKFISMLDAKSYWIASNTKLGLTQDAGGSWQTLDLPEGLSQLVGMRFNSIEEGYLLDSLGTLFKTTDSGNTWSPSVIKEIGKGIPAYASPTAAIHFKDSDHGFIVFIDAKLQVKSLSTKDGGLTWETLTMPDVKWGHVYLTIDGQYLTLSNTGASKVTLLTLN